MRPNLRLIHLTMILFVPASTLAGAELQEKKATSWVPEITLVGALSVVSIAFIAVVGCKKAPAQRVRKAHHHKRSAVWIGKDFQVGTESSEHDPSMPVDRQPSVQVQKVQMAVPRAAPVRNPSDRECIVYTDPHEMELRISRQQDSGSLELSNFDSVVFEGTLSRSTTDAVIDFLETGVEPNDSSATEVIGLLRRNGFKALPI